MAKTVSGEHSCICMLERMLMSPGGKKSSTSQARSTSLSMPTTLSSARGFCNSRNFFMHSSRAASVVSIIAHRTMPSRSLLDIVLGRTFASLYSSSSFSDVSRILFVASGSDSPNSSSSIIMLLLFILFILFKLFKLFIVLLLMILLLLMNLVLLLLFMALNTVLVTSSSSL